MTDALKAREMLELYNIGPTRSAIEDCFVLLVDLQERLLPAIANGNAIVSAADRLARGAGILGIPVWATEHCPGAIGPTIRSLRRQVPERQILEKRRFDALSQDGVRVRLSALERRCVVVAGTETHVCVAQSALGLLEAGWRVFVAEDACGSRRDSDREVGLARLRAAGCVPVTVEALLFEWLGGADHPRFRDVLSIIKEA